MHVPVRENNERCRQQTASRLRLKIFHRVSLRSRKENKIFCWVLHTRKRIKRVDSWKRETSTN